MSLIACTDPCIYQKDGYCSLSRAASGGYPSDKQSCVHFLPVSTHSKNGSQGLPNVSDKDKI